MELLQTYTAEWESIEPLQYELEYLYFEMNEDRLEQEKKLKEQLSEVAKKIDTSNKKIG